MNTIRKSVVVSAVLSVLLLSACASTSVSRTGAPLDGPLCQAGTPAVPTFVFWGSRWRPDQKEPQLREAAALRGIEDFLAGTDCLKLAGIQRLPPGAPLPSDSPLPAGMAAASAAAERIVFIVVRELGPRLEIGIPLIVEGGTEVLLDVRVLDTRSPAVLADTRTHWRNGGSFVIKGVKTLDSDMSAALAATLMPGTARP